MRNPVAVLLLVAGCIPADAVLAADPKGLQGALVDEFVRIIDETRTPACDRVRSALGILSALDVLAARYPKEIPAPTSLRADIARIASNCGDDSFGPRPGVGLGVSVPVSLPGFYGGVKIERRVPDLLFAKQFMSPAAWDRLQAQLPDTTKQALAEWTKVSPEVVKALEVQFKAPSARVDALVLEMEKIDPKELSPNHLLKLAEITKKSKEKQE